MFGQRKLQAMMQESLLLTVQAFQQAVNQLVDRESRTLGQIQRVYSTAMDEVLRAAHLVAAMAQAQVDRGASRILASQVQSGIPDPFADPPDTAGDAPIPDIDEDFPQEEELLGVTPPGEAVPVPAAPAEPQSVGGGS